MVVKLWIKQLLIKPAPTPYLMASNKARLLAGAGKPLLYTNPPQVLANTLDNADLK